jgi:uncharacterized protein YjiS (DUF1127 family)
MFKTLAPRSTDDLWPFAEQPQAGAPASLMQRLAESLLAMSQSVVERCRYLKARHDLDSLDERMLRDIGVTRSEIGRVVRYGRFD